MNETELLVSVFESVQELTKILKIVSDKQDRLHFELKSLWDEFNELNPPPDPKPSADKVKIL